MDRHQTDERKKLMLVLHTLTMWECDVASLVEFRSGVKEEIALRTDEWTTDARKNMLLAHTFTKRESDVVSLVEFCLVV